MIRLITTAVLATTVMGTTVQMHAGYAASAPVVVPPKDTVYATATMVESVVGQIAEFRWVSETDATHSGTTRHSWPTPNYVCISDDCTKRICASPGDWQQQVLCRVQLPAGTDFAKFSMVAVAPNGLPIQVTASANFLQPTPALINTTTPFKPTIVIPTTTNTPQARVDITLYPNWAPVAPTGWVTVLNDGIDFVTIDFTMPMPAQIRAQCHTRLRGMSLLAYLCPASTLDCGPTTPNPLATDTSTSGANTLSTLTAARADDYTIVLLASGIELEDGKTISNRNDFNCVVTVVPTPQ